MTLCVAGALLALLALFLGIDHVPRFMLGDSQSYLATQWANNYPPDRSWIYGLFVHGVMAVTRGLGTYIVIQAVALAAVMAAVALAFPSRHSARGCAAVFVLAIVLDPLTEAYVRFYMSDLSAGLMFAAFIALLAVSLFPAGAARRARWRVLVWTAMAMCGIGAVAFRLAYAPIELATLTLCMAASGRKRDRRVLPGLAAACLIPILAVALQTAANRVVFADRFPGAIFANRLARDFVMGVFSPALTAADIRSAGVPVTDAEVARMDLPDYGNRAAQVWGDQPFLLHNVIKSRIGAPNEYDGRYEAAAGAIVAAALRRAPLAFVAVYVESLSLYAEPSEWSRHIDEEMGLHRPLDAWFLSYANGFLNTKLAAASPERRSIWPRALELTVGAYPLLLLAGGLAAVAALAGWGPARHRLPAAALLATVLVAPLYSNYVIPRYVIAAVWFSWLLVPQAVAAWVRVWWPERPPRPSEGCAGAG